MNRTVSGWIRTGARRAKGGFTLVELLVVVAIIGLLVGLLVPAVFAVQARFERKAVKLEVQALNDAVETYRSQNGDYPPDGSSWPVMERHFRKVCPDILNSELSLMNPTSLTYLGSLDRAEALVFFLGGFSKDKQRPFTGTGGPLVNIGTPAAPIYRYNGSRENAFYPFPTGRLTVEDLNAGSPPQLFSNDEALFAGAANDPFPVFMARNNTVLRGAPYVYFDSRTYFANIGTAAAPIPNCYQPSNILTVTQATSARGEFGAVRPLLESVSSSGAFVFQNNKTFQIIAPGRDGKYGGRLVALGAQWFTLTGLSFTYNGTIMIKDTASTSKFDLNENNGIVDRPSYDNASNFAELDTFGDSAQ